MISKNEFHFERAGYERSSRQRGSCTFVLNVVKQRSAPVFQTFINFHPLHYLLLWGWFFPLKAGLEYYLCASHDPIAAPMAYRSWQG